MMGFGLVFVLLVVGAIAYAGGWRPQFGHSSQADNSVGRGSSNALEILRERYARGEIDKEQYERIRTDLLG